MYHVKINLQELLRSNKSIVLDVGCGPQKRISSAIGIDIDDYPSVDIVGDVFEVLRDMPSNRISEIHAHHFVEHIEDVKLFLSECNRVLSRSGLLRVSVPHFSNPYFYSDPTHLRFFGLYTMSYFIPSNLFKRAVPRYSRNSQIDLSLEQVSLRFKAPREFPISYVLLRIFGLMANFNRGTREFYERWLTGVVPCYEISYDIRKSGEQQAPD